MWSVVWLLGIVCFIVTISVTLLVPMLSSRGSDPTMCSRCGYSRFGLPGGSRCPECGERPPEVEPEPARPSAGGPRVDAASLIPLAAFGVVSLGIVGVSGSGLGGLIFTVIVGVFPYLVVAGTILALRARFGLRTRLTLAVSGSATVAGSYAWLVVHEFIIHPSPDAGLVVLVLPVVGTSAAGYGLLIGLVIAKALDWSLGERRAG